MGLSALISASGGHHRSAASQKPAWTPAGFAVSARADETCFEVLRRIIATDVSFKAATLNT